MSRAEVTDILQLEEERIRSRFKLFGADVLNAVERVFARYGHLRPLIEHLQLTCEGNLESQQDVLLKCLQQCGTETFLLGIEKGENPRKLMLSGPVQLADQLSSTLKVMGLMNAAEIQNNSEKVATETSASERRKRSPGRRQKVSLDYPDCRRKAPCRRSNN